MLALRRSQCNTYPPRKKRKRKINSTSTRQNNVTTTRNIFFTPNSALRRDVEARKGRKGRNETTTDETKAAGRPWTSGHSQGVPWSKCHSARLNPKGHSLRTFTVLNRITRTQPTEAPKTQQSEKNEGDDKTRRQERERLEWRGEKR